MKKYLMLGAASLALAACATSEIDPVSVADLSYHGYCSTLGKDSQYCSKQYQRIEASAVGLAKTAEDTIAQAKADGSWSQALQDHEQAIIEDALAMIADFKAGRQHHTKIAS